MLAFRFKHLMENETFSRNLLMLLPDKLFMQGDLKSDFTLCEMSTGKCHRSCKPLSTYTFDTMKSNDL